VPQYQDSCPLCGRNADVRPLERERFLVRCPFCRPVILDERLFEVLTNARRRNIAAVLDLLPGLSLASQRTCERGELLILTSTNWVRVSMAHSQMPAETARAGSF